MQEYKHTDEDLAAYRKMMGLPPEPKAKKPKEAPNAQTGGEQNPGAAGGQGQVGDPAAPEVTREEARAALEAKTDDELLALALEAGIEETDRSAIIEKLLEPTEA